jgi:NAD(P)-dependent dehydrogenase (short-subunit alcohol dehydrogenase family)
VKDLKDKVAVVTGAASGIGLAFSQRCLQEGMKVVLADIDRLSLGRVEQKLGKDNAMILPVVTDVRKSDDVKKLAEVTYGEFGATHILFNNAGVGVSRLVHEATLNDWNWVIGTNLFGVIHGVQSFVPRMIQQNTDCHVINTASISGLVTGAMNGPYSVSKAAIIMLSEKLYFEMRGLQTKVKVSVVCPGFIATNIMAFEDHRPSELRNPSEPQLRPDFIAYATEFLKHVLAGMKPRDCADIIFREAIQDGRFYIMPNSTQRLWQDAIRQRAENTMKRLYPTEPVSGWEDYDRRIKQG